MKDTHESSDHAPYRPASSCVQATAHGGLSPAGLSNVIVVYDSGYLGCGLAVHSAKSLQRGRKGGRGPPEGLEDNAGCRRHAGPLRRR